MVILAELLCFEGKMKEASVVIRKLNSGYKKFNILGLMYLQNFRFSFDRSRDFDNFYDLQGSDYFLLNSKKNFSQSNSDFNNNIQSIMGLILVSFFQKDWKTYSVKFSLLKNQIKNKVIKNIFIIFRV